MGEMGTANVEFKAFGDELDRLAKIAEEMPPDVARIEAAIENGLVEPFFEALGYDMRDWRHARKQYGPAKWNEEKVDYALVGCNGEPLILVECKSLALTLDEADWQQLRRYYNDTGAKVGILTNGKTYEIYLDEDELRGMDQEPFFKFELGAMDELALRAAFALTRLEDATFDLEGFKTDVETWRFTTDYRPRAIQLFKSWKSQPDDEFVSFVEKRINAPAGTLGELLTGWFAEFAGVHEKKKNGPPPPPPPPEALPLPDWPISDVSDLPDEITFPDGTSAEINDGYDVPVKIVGWLMNKGHLERDSLPIRTGKNQRGKLHLVSEAPRHPDGSRMRSPKSVSGVFVYGSYGAPAQIENAQRIIQYAKQDPREFKGEFPPEHTTA